MIRQLVNLCAGVALAIGPASVSAAEAARERLVVMNLDTEGLDPALAKPLNEFLLTEFQAADRYEVIGGSDVVAMLEAEAQKQLLGCDDEDCMAQIAGAMNARLMASASVGQVSGSYLVNLKVIDVRDTRVLARASVKSGGTEDQLMAAVQTAVRMVTATSSVLDELPQVSPLPIGLWGGAAAALGAGVFFGIKAQGHHRDFMDPTYADVEGAERDGRRSQMLANVAFGTAIVSAGAGVLTWWLTGDRVEVLREGDEQQPAVAAAEVAP